eukprot:NODE_7388_length_1583_cov_7.656593.p1 GENE.NODE_7388_length_1583_cov_7.656593~~NODE_7388_length_1583_cov_7.656593.p1  ORF type:complete len:425 (+),score=112.31 NODE_7388_length_1583_cov_7.656593:89-1363(+)
MRTAASPCIALMLAARSCPYPRPPQLVRGATDYAGAWREHKLALRGLTPGEAHLSALERMAADHVDPAKLRWQRTLTEVVRASSSYQPPQLTRAVAALAMSPLALHAPTAAPLLDAAVNRLRFSLDGFSRSDRATIALVLAQTRVFLPRGTVGRSEAVAVAGDVASARALLWQQLLPRGLAGDATGREELLLASAVSWQVAHSDSLRVKVQPALHKAAVDGLADAAALPRRLGVDAVPLARLLSALGLLRAQDALPPLGDSDVALARRLMRRLSREALKRADLQTLMLLDLGLRNLGLGRSHAAKDTGERIKARVAAAASSGHGLATVCAALLLLRACGRLLPRAPWIFELVRAATNGSDRLTRSERTVMREVLLELAGALGNAQAHSFRAGSVEASIARLTRLDWFGRRPRAEVSWYQQRHLI